MGGRHALALAGMFPEQFRATACLHGAGLTREGADSPHLVARTAEGEIYCGHAERDRYAAPDVVEQLDRALSGGPARYRSVVHPGAQHSYAVADRDVFDAEATAADWHEILAMFSRQLN
jgi:carboxymethylenebutenolidase